MQKHMSKKKGLYSMENTAFFVGLSCRIGWFLHGEESRKDAAQHGEMIDIGRAPSAPLRWAGVQALAGERVRAPAQVRAPAPAGMQAVSAGPPVFHGKRSGALPAAGNSQRRTTAPPAIK